MADVALTNTERVTMLRLLAHLAWHQFTNCYSQHRHCANCGGRGANLTSDRKWRTCESCEGAGSHCPKFRHG